MRRLHKRRSHKAGLPPGSLVHIGEKKAEKAKITLIDFEPDGSEERVIDRVEDCYPEKLPPNRVCWVNVDGVHDTDTLEKLGVAYGLHPLTLEDILNTDQRPKMEDYETYLFVVIKMLWPGKGQELLHVEQLSLIIGPTFVLTFQETEGDIFNSIRDRIRTNKGRVRKQGADYLAYTLVDTVVDHYFLILEELEERIEKLEESLLADGEGTVLRVIQHMKRELIYLRRSVWPLREVVGGLQRGESDLISGTTQVYLRDVHDHTVQVIDTMESFRDLIAGILELHLSTISNRMNNIMKVLTVIATTFIPLTFIAGVYGMNFEYMPELKWAWGYPAALAVMAAVGGFMMLYFKRKNWM